MENKGKKIASCMKELLKTDCVFEKGQLDALRGVAPMTQKIFEEVLEICTMLEDLELRDACAKVRRCVGCLSPREAHIIRLRYGLDDRAPLTQREIATLCGISRSYVSRIEKKALEKLRVEYEKL